MELTAVEFRSFEICIGGLDKYFFIVSAAEIVSNAKFVYVSVVGVPHLIALNVVQPVRHKSVSNKYVRCLSIMQSYVFL